MTKKLHDGESDRRKQVKFRAPRSLVEQFDEWVEQHDEHDNRTDALKSAMRRMIDQEDTQAPRQPPADEELRTAYLSLVSLCNHDGTIPHEIAVNELATKLSKPQKVVERRVLQKLRQRGYLRHLTTVQGTYRSWTVRGYRDARGDDA